jgi:drug/metabolite transporter (DMT)-like permease
LAQIIGTSLLLIAVTESSFAVGTAYSKTEVVQAALVEVVVLGAVLMPTAVLAMALATLGVMLMAMKDAARPLHALVEGLSRRGAWIGIASGGMFGIAAVGFRTAAVGLEATPFVMAAGFTLMVSISLQSVVLGSWLTATERGQWAHIARTWRAGALAGATGALASACWFTAFTLTVAAYVRTLGLIELVFAFAASALWFRERAKPLEVVGVGLLAVGIVLILNG